MELPFDPASSGLARAAAWMLDRIVADDLSEAHVDDPACWRLTQPAEQVLTLFRNARRPISAVRSYEEVRPDLARISVLDDLGRRMTVRVWMDPCHPGVPSRFSQVPEREGYTVRPAAPEDAPALAWLEAQVPVERADGSTVTYHRPDALAQLRLMGDVARSSSSTTARSWDPTSTPSTTSTSVARRRGPCTACTPASCRNIKAQACTRR